MSDHPDHAVVRAAAAGDAKAQRLLFDRHAERVHRIAFRMMGDRDAADDVTQDTFVRAFDRLNEFRGDSSFGTWIHRIAVSVTLNAIRARRSRESRELPLEGATEAAEPELLRDGLEPDLRERVAQAVRALPDDLRLVLVMFDVEGYAHGEIAAMLAITPAACRQRLVRARAALAAALHLDRLEWET